MIYNYLILIFEIFLASLANILLKKGSLVLSSILIAPKNIKDAIDIALAMFKNVYILSGLVAFGVAFFLWVWLLSKIQLNIFYPIALSTQIILIAVISRSLFKEPLTVIQILGILIIITGVLLLAKTS